jgi:hypothetical protein
MSERASNLYAADRLAWPMGSGVLLVAGLGGLLSSFDDQRPFLIGITKALLSIRNISPGSPEALVAVTRVPGGSSWPHPQGRPTWCGTRLRQAIESFTSVRYVKPLTAPAQTKLELSLPGAVDAPVRS